ncbi:hypothetical protein SMICM304S_10855 [Streptomyces microflavus]
MVLTIGLGLVLALSAFFSARIARPKVYTVSETLDLRYGGGLDDLRRRRWLAIPEPLAVTSTIGSAITGESLLLSTGPGALTSLAALQEAAAASAPVLAISSQVPTAGLGGGRHGYLHELRDQQASVRDIVKSVHTVRSASQIPSAIAAAWESALTAPHGPVWVEIPQDVLLAETTLPVVSAMDATPRELYPRPELPSPRPTCCRTPNAR